MRAFHEMKILIQICRSLGAKHGCLPAPELTANRDVLYVDEAGQVSLGNLVAMATAAKSVLLVGDQMQLAQPLQGAHPRNSGCTALDHLLEGHAVVPAERGIFLSKTWRMHPDLCLLVSAAVYEGKLHLEKDCATQRLILAKDAHPALKAAVCLLSLSIMMQIGGNLLRRPRRHERKSLPLRSLCEHRYGDRARHANEPREHVAMMNFSYLRAGNVGEAVRAIADDPTAKFIAGGTNLLDLMKYDVERPARLIDVTRLPLRVIEETANGGLRIGALVTNTDAAYNPNVQRCCPLFASAILAGASPQLRNAATIGGNLLQRTRCYYFYDPATPCNKRQPGTGCSAITGVNRIHAILGASEHCIATHPSDMCVALAALDAVIHVEGRDGRRIIPFAEFHRLPGDAPNIDSNLRHDEIIVAVELPPGNFATHYSYLKLRDRLSYSFALVSVAAALHIEEGAIASARLALGGVAHKPWRNTDAEALLLGKPVTGNSFTAAADLILTEARAYEHNAFKIDLARRAIIRALSQAAAGTPQLQADKRIL